MYLCSSVFFVSQPFLGEKDLYKPGADVCLAGKCPEVTALRYRLSDGHSSARNLVCDAIRSRRAMDMVRDDWQQSARLTAGSRRRERSIARLRVGTWTFWYPSFFGRKRSRIGRSSPPYREGQAFYFGSGARPNGPKPKAQKAESGLEFLGRGSQPPPH